MSADAIKIETRDGIGLATLDRPAKRNAMTLAMWQGIALRFEELGSDPAVRAIVLSGAGGHFSVGADVSEFAAVRGSAQAAKEYEYWVDAAADAIAAAPKPVIAALDGYCLGGGCHLALAADFRFASPAAKVGIPAARLSIVYGVRSTQRLLALVGLSAAKRILYGAEHLDAATVHAMGLVDRIVAEPLAEALAHAAELARLAPLSIAGAKSILTDLSMALGPLDPARAQSIIDNAADSNDYDEGRRAFREKRPAVFHGR